MPLGMEVGLDPDHIVLDGPALSPPKTGAQQPPTFGACLLWPNRWMDQDTAWYGGRPRPGHIVVDGTRERGTAPPTFQPMSVVAKRLDGSRCHLVQRKASAQSTLC